jgi:zinc D-Ala-D-Ala carboxypeptidase
MQLSKHFSLAEFCVTQSKLQNVPDKGQLARLQNTAANMELVRAAVGGKVITPSSVFRSEAVNTEAGGSPTSAHMSGDAVDFNVSGVAKADVLALIITAAIPFDQLIDENKGGKSWIHISFAPALRGEYKLYKSGKYTLIRKISWH